MIHFDIGRNGGLVVISTGATEAEFRAKLKQLEDQAARARDPKIIKSLQTKAEAVRLTMAAKFTHRPKTRDRLAVPGIEYR